MPLRRTTSSQALLAASLLVLAACGQQRVADSATPATTGPAALTIAPGNNTLVSGLGGASGYGETDLVALGGPNYQCDDGFWQLNLSSVFPNGIDFFGKKYSASSQVFASTNGYISFGQGNSGYTPDGISYSTLPLVAGLYSDLYFCVAGQGHAYLDLDTTASDPVATLTYLDVPAFPGDNLAQRDSFQIRLHRVYSDPVNGDKVGVELRYAKLDWSTASSMDSKNGTGGWADGQSDGSTPTAVYGEVAYSGTSNVKLNATNTSAASNRTPPQPGVYYWQPYLLQIVSGTPQTAATNGSFASPLRVQATDPQGNPASGVSVTFRGPASGAGATASPITGTTDAEGMVEATATANGTAGTYQVAAFVSGNGFSNAAYFDLTNASAPVAVCGNGVVEAGEACDDHNTANGDGCSSTCQVETGWSCPGGTSCAPVCGDGLKKGAEACDDHNTANGDGCSSTCTVETGWTCPSGTSCAPICGDGLKLGNEQCDDGNTTPADGCSATCKVEPGYSCPTDGAACVAVCGDGILTAGEECDDGNTTDGDGCSSACKVEAGSACFFTSPNLIQNGSFDQGSTGWTSAYTWKNPSTVNAIYDEGTWSVSGDGHHLHDAIAQGFKDAEGSASKMAAYFNGASTALDALTQTVNLTAGKTYVLSMYVTNWGGAGDSPYPKLSISVGGQVLTTDVTLSSSGWQRVGGTFVAASTGPATLKVVDSVTAATGNDFAVDGVILREATGQVCGQVCAMDADCATAGAGYWCDTTAVGHPAFCTPPLPPGAPIPTVPNRDPNDPPLDGTCTPANAGTACSGGACNAAQSTCANPTGACTLNSECVSNVCGVNACVPQYTVRFQTDGTAGASVSPSASQAVLSGGNAAAVTALAPAAHNFARWTGTSGFVGTSANPLTVTGVTADLLLTAHFAGVGSFTAVSGAEMSATVQAAYPDPLCVEVRDIEGALLAGAPVHFALPSSGASATGSTDTTSDEGGLACIDLTATTTSGSFAVTASSAGVSSSVASLTNLPGAAHGVEIFAGDGQRASVDGAFASPLTVVVLDVFRNPVPGVLVGFQVSSSTATATLSSHGLVTGGDGHASVTATPDTVSGPFQVIASAEGVETPATFELLLDAGAPASVTADLLSTPQTAQVATAFQNSLAVVVRDAHGNPVPGVAVLFTAPGSGASAEFSDNTATTGDDGGAVVDASANTVSGGYQVTASVEGVTEAAAFFLTNQPGAPNVLAVADGSPQEAVVDAAFAPLRVVIRDQYANPVPDVEVTFTFPGSGASAVLGSSTATTSANGTAQVNAVAGTVAGAYFVTATAPEVLAPVQFTLANLPGAPVALVVASASDGQATRVGEGFASPLTVTVVDVHGNAVPGVPVSFACPASGATCTLDAESATSDEGGEVSVRATAGQLPGRASVVATAEGLPPVTIHLSDLVGLPGSIASTGGASQETGVLSDYAGPLAVEVTDSFGNVVPGVEVTFEVVSAGTQSVTLSAASATTDADGLASVTAVANAFKGPVTVRAAAPGVASRVEFTLTNTAIVSTLTLDIQLPVFGTVISANGVSHLLATVGPNAGETPPTGTVRFQASRTIRPVPGQAGVTQDGDDIVATLVNGTVDVQVQVVGWRSRTLQVTYAPDTAAAATWDPVTKTVDLVADVPHQTHGGGGCSTGGGSVPLTALPLLLLALRFRRRRR